MKGRTEKSKRLLAEMSRVGVTVPEMARDLGVSYSYLCAVIYGRYESEKIFQMAQEYVKGVDKNGREDTGSPAEDAGDQT